MNEPYPPDEDEEVCITGLRFVEYDAPDHSVFDGDITFDNRTRSYKQWHGNKWWSIQAVRTNKELVSAARSSVRWRTVVQVWDPKAGIWVTQGVIADERSLPSRP